MSAGYKISLGRLDTLRKTRPGLENFVPNKAMQLLVGAIHSTYIDEALPQWPHKIKEHMQKEVQENIPIDLLGNLHAFYINALWKGSSRKMASDLTNFLPDELINPERTYDPPEHRLSLPESTTQLDTGADHEN
eukprot:TRINITY_DN16366_c0_g1_i1.p1 TRINITY_DN16366_c0_g1~~TRINITY_DN16366_c0_g1_i1.p1  ORF type:complete len:134 (+),score=20.69 TRINITY_DN16366_c0_g1_i1:225-626(+)